MTIKRLPCYCLPGPARCDTLGEHCDRFCGRCHPELHRAQCSGGGCVIALQAELDELERTDPDVRAAAESHDRMVERITGRQAGRPCCDPATHSTCTCDCHEPPVREASE